MSRRAFGLSKRYPPPFPLHSQYRPRYRHRRIANENDSDNENDDDDDDEDDIAPTVTPSTRVSSIFLDISYVKTRNREHAENNKTNVEDFLYPQSHARNLMNLFSIRPLSIYLFRQALSGELHDLQMAWSFRSFRIIHSMEESNRASLVERTRRLRSSSCLTTKI